MPKSNKPLNASSQCKALTFPGGLFEAFQESKELRKPEISQVNYVCRSIKAASSQEFSGQDRKLSKSRHPLVPDGAAVVLERPLVQPIQRGLGCRGSAYP
ncbi:hypothetical protein TNCV_2494881 [Trichonephila clavipes]|nr:hypothetical protein TNCV_2494881 [Trichonephila clavipes]